MNSIIEQKIFNYVVVNLEKNVSKKLKNSNTMKSNLANPHTRTIQISNASQHAFASRYGSKFEGEEVVIERKTKNSTALFKINTLEKASRIFTSSTISRFNSALLAIYLL